MNASYNYADFIGLNLDSKGGQVATEQALQELKPPPRKSGIKSEPLDTGHSKNRLKQ